MPIGSSDGRCFAAGRFATTCWSQVVAAGRSSSAESRQALEELCGAYWYPIYVHVRRAGHDPPAAQDLTQAFFARVLEKRLLPRADRQRGRFRSFLLGSLRNFLSNERDRRAARKRGGDCRFFSINLNAAESRYLAEPCHGATAERSFERQWALAVLERSLGALERDYHDSGRSELFDALSPFLTTGGDGAGYGATAERLQMTEAAAKMAASRLRRRYRELIREEIARTVAESSEVEDELNRLFAALSRE